MTNLLSKLMLSHFCSFYSCLSFFLSSANINRVLFTSFTLEKRLQKAIFLVKFLNIQKINKCDDIISPVNDKIVDDFVSSNIQIKAIICHEIGPTYRSMGQS